MKNNLKLGLFSLVVGTLTFLPTNINAQDVTTSVPEATTTSLPETTTMVGSETTVFEEVTTESTTVNTTTVENTTVATETTSEEETYYVPVIAFTEVPRYFDTKEDAEFAYPDLEVVEEDGRFVVYTDLNPIETYEFETLEDAEYAFPQYEVTEMDGKFYVTTDELPFVQYEFETLEDAEFAFPEEDIEEIDGVFYVVTDELPSQLYLFDSKENALIAFPGSEPELIDGVWVLYTNAVPVEGTTEPMSEEEWEAFLKEHSDSETAKKVLAKRSKTTADQAKLPATGEKSTQLLVSLSSLLGIIGAGLVIYNKKHS